jgi:hypothetical protein
MTDLTRVPFHGTDIYAAEINGVPHVAPKPVCETLGLDWSAQYRRLQRQPWAAIAMMATPSAGGSQNTMMIDRQTFVMWLATIDTSRVKDTAARDLIVTYQREAAQALDRYFNEGGAINPNATEHQLNALIRRAQMEMELCQAAKGLIRPEHLEAKARIILARGMGEQPELDPQTRPLYTQNYLEEKGVKSPRLQKIAGVFGKRVKAAYILKYGRDPEKYPLNLSNGQIRNVNAYTEADRPMFDSVWDQYYAKEAA